MSATVAERLVGTLYSGVVTEGPRVVEFERALEPVLGRVLTTNSCTSAIWLALKLAGVGPGDEVVSTPMTCVATNLPILHLGATIRWADIDASGRVTPETLGAAITPKTRAVVVVDWAGSPVPRPALDLPVIEDAAHAFGAPCEGDYVAYSFQAVKHLTTGDGGALRVPEPERARRLRWFGMDRDLPLDKRTVAEPGFKFHMNDIAATIGLANLPLARLNLGVHQSNAAYYAAELGLPFDAKGSYWVFTLMVRDKERFREQMAARGIETGELHYRNDAYAAFGGRCDLPGVARFELHAISIPCGFWVDAERVVRAAKELR